MNLSEEQLWHHGATIAQWLADGKPLMQFKGTTGEWKDVVGVPSWCTPNAYRKKPLPRVIYVNSYTSGDFDIMPAHPTREAALDATEGAPDSIVDFRAKKFVEVL